MLITCLPGMRARLFAICSIVAVVPFPAPAQAQEGNEADPIVVVGTRIPRPDANAPSPIVALDRNDLNQFRDMTLEDFFETLPQVSPDYGRATNNPGEGTASIDLRGMGRGRTLILLNGRRLAPTGTDTAVDINAIPNVLISRIEIVTGGASAVYGSDAVTGAVNFVVRDDLEGVEAAAQYDVYGAGDGEAYNGSLAGGTHFADGRGHLTLFVDWLHRTPVLGGDRDFTQTQIGEDRVRGVLFARGSTLTAAGGVSSPRALINGVLVNPVFEAGGGIHPFTNADRYNFAPDNYLQVPLRRLSAGAFARFEPRPGLELFTELMWSQPTVDAQLAAAPAIFPAAFTINGPFFNDQSRPILSAAYDGDDDGVGQALLIKRFTDIGPRRRSAEREYARAVLGFVADISETWRLEGAYSYARNETVTQLQNAASLARVRQGLLIDPLTGGCVDPSNGCVPVNIFGVGVLSAEAANFIRVDSFENRDEAVQHLVSVVATGEIFTWSQGTARASAGLEYRRNRARFAPSPIYSTGDALGFAGGFNASQPRGGAIEVYEAFGEVLVPLLQDQPLARQLLFEAGGRVSDYATSGTVWTWKAGGQWQPAEPLRLRGMYQRAVRAPNIGELFTTPSSAIFSFPTFLDFCRASNDPTGRGFADICISQGMDPAQVGVFDLPNNTDFIVNQILTGNPALEPETATTTTFGFDYTFPTASLIRVAADYFSIEIEDAIRFIDTPFTTCPITRAPGGVVCSTITREPGGAVSSVTFRPENLSLAQVEGVDLSLEIEADPPRWLRFAPGARLHWRTLGTIYFNRGEAETDNSPFIDCAGGFALFCKVAVGLDDGAGTAFPDRRLTSTLSYSTDRWSASVRWRWLDGVDNLAPVFAALSNQPPPNLPIPRVGERSYLDLAFSAELSERARLRLGVDNVLEEEPPLLGDEQSQSNTDPSLYDVFGRRFFIGFEWRFGGQ